MAQLYEFMSPWRRYPIYIQQPTEAILSLIQNIVKIYKNSFLFPED
jgi:hypothetical protein